MSAPEPTDEPADPSSLGPDPEASDAPEDAAASDGSDTPEDATATDDETPHPLGPIGASLDEVVDRAWDRLRGNPALDRLFYTASELGDFSLIWHLLGTARGVTLRGGTREAARLALALGAESALVNGMVKSAFRRERPIQSGERPHNLRQPLTSSFPSGHASAAFLAATLLSERSKVKPLWFGLATIVATSRIHVRIHHASDVVLGAGIGLTLGRLIRRVVPLR
jgi:membrane-associated phospholipid phosphatase|tara:strand:+ start:3059 stop:3733 length:675 start_codon:yes stop_codon:yes gene_type:complete